MGNVYDRDIYDFEFQPRFHAKLFSQIFRGSSLLNICFTVEDISRVLGSLDVYKALGPDNLPTLVNNVVIML